MRKLASIRRVTDIVPIPGADLIELAVVDGWKCVIKKSEFKPGDLAIYCEIDSFLPLRPEFEFLRKSSFRKLENDEGFRLRTVRLRGQISQGLLLPVILINRAPQIGDDVTEELGIRKWDPPLPANIAGDIAGNFPGEVSRTDEERVQNLIYEEIAGREFFVTEKIDGTSFTSLLDDQGRLCVCSRNYQLKETPTNLLWAMARRADLEEKLKSLDRRLAVQGELAGPGIQGNLYKLTRHELFVFNFFDIDRYEYLDKAESQSLCEAFSLTSVPVIGSLIAPPTIDEMLSMADGPSKLNSKAAREGLVWVSGQGSKRISFKAISNSFLAENG